MINTDDLYSKLPNLPYGNTPSIKTMIDRLGITRKTATLIKKVISGKIDLTLFDSANNRIRECYNYPDRLDVTLHVISDLMSMDLWDTYGLEYIHTTKDDMFNTYGVEYVNRGDTYKLTFCYDHNKERFYISSWGDIVERNPDFYA